MKFLADAHISRKIVDFIVAQGNDCTLAAYLPAATTDDVVLQIAVREKRFLVTSDKDFGQLVFRDSLPVPGVVLLRADEGSEDDRVEVLQKHWQTIVSVIVGHFVTVTPERVRSRPLE